ncbi:hypothetical protein ACFWBF_05410 [Streptomyces sp. NPDC060028]|uniref:hypothetical protein n=1 Tax=Streptomyces sp. NPDC060028 TaxID=3347041 RepID=UPI003680724F
MACKSKPAGPPPPCSTGGPVTDTTSTMTLAVKPSSVRSLLSDAQFNDVMHTVLDNNPGMEPGLAGNILVDALAFLAAAAVAPGAGLVPSRVVDEGWHALILHTGLYQSLCARLGGFIHHVPERPDPGQRWHGDIERTVAAIEAAGYADVVEAMRAVRYAQTPDRQGPTVVRGFVVAEPDAS